MQANHVEFRHAYIIGPDKKSYFREQLALGVGESIYGRRESESSSSKIHYTHRQTGTSARLDFRLVTNHFLYYYYDEQTVMGFVDGMAERDLPLHVFHFDCFWMKEYQWCNFEWDSDVFPDPAGMIRRMKAKGLKICVWINPYISQTTNMFQEGKAGGFLLKYPDGCRLF